MRSSKSTRPYPVPIVHPPITHTRTTSAAGHRPQQPQPLRRRRWRYRRRRLHRPSLDWLIAESTTCKRDGSEGYDPGWKHTAADPIFGSELKIGWRDGSTGGWLDRCILSERPRRWRRGQNWPTLYIKDFFSKKISGSILFGGKNANVSARMKNISGNIFLKR